MTTEQDCLPKLRREAIVPEPHRSGAGWAVLGVLALAMFTFGIAPALLAPTRTTVTTCDSPELDGAQIAWFGVRVRSYADGAQVLDAFPNSAAHRAGIRPGDVVLGIRTADDHRSFERVASSTGLVHRIRSHNPGDVVDVRFARGGDVHVVRTALGSIPVTALCRAR